MTRRASALAAAALLALPGAAGALEQDPRFDLERVRGSLDARDDPLLVSGAQVGNRVVAVGTGGGGGIVLYQYGLDGVPRGAVPLNLGEFAFAELAVFDRASQEFLVVGTSEGDLFVARGVADEPRTVHQTSIARKSEVRAIAAATDGARDYVALDRPARPPELFALTPAGQPIGAFGANGRRVLSGLRNVTALAVAPDGRSLLVAVLRPDFTTRVVRLDARTGRLLKGADVDDVSAIRGFVQQGGRLFGVTSGNDGLQRLVELNAETFEPGKARRLQIEDVVPIEGLDGRVVLCGRTLAGGGSCRQMVGGRLLPLVPLDWGTDAEPVGGAVGASGSTVLVGRGDRESRLALGRDVGTSVRVVDARRRPLAARRLAAALRRSLRSGRLPVAVNAPEVGRLRIRLLLGRRVLDVRTARAGGDSTTVRLRLGRGDRAAVARARLGSRRASLRLEARMVDGAGNRAQQSVRAVLP